MTLTEFITARLAEDLESAAFYDRFWERAELVDPDRMRREVAFKRAVLDRHKDGRPDWYTDEDRADSPAWCEWCTYDDRTVWFPCPDVQALADVWVAHPDYDPAWAVTPDH